MAPLSFLLGPASALLQASPLWGCRGHSPCCSWQASIRAPKPRAHKPLGTPSIPQEDEVNPFRRNQKAGMFWRPARGEMCARYVALGGREYRGFVR